MGPRRSAAGVERDEVDLARAAGHRRLADEADAATVVEVSVGVDRAAGRAVVTVADDGPGIAPEEGDRVFERFARLDPARSAADGGTGLGLAIARDVAVRHGGTIELVGHGSADLPGARFVVSLPLAD